MMHEEATTLLETQFASGPLPPQQTLALRQHMSGCARCTRHYARLHRLEQLMDASTTPRAQVDRMLAMTDAVLDDVVTPSNRRTRWWWTAGPALAVAATLLLAVDLGGLAGLASRGGEIDARSWVGVYVKQRSRPPVRLEPDGQLASNAGLIFDYTNLEEGGARYVIVVGRDSSDRVHWYHPAFRSAEDDPSSLAIEVGVNNRLLDEVVYADHPEGELEVCAVFTDEPLRVRDVDSAIERGGEWPKAKRLDCRRFEVVK